MMINWLSIQICLKRVYIKLLKEYSLVERPDELVVKSDSVASTIIGSSTRNYMYTYLYFQFHLNTLSIEKKDIFLKIILIFDSSNDWLIECWISRSKTYHLFGDVTIAGEGLQTLTLCSALVVSKQRWDLYSATRAVRRGHDFCGLVWKKPPYLVALCDKQGRGNKGHS